MRPLRYLRQSLFLCLPMLACAEDPREDGPPFGSGLAESTDTATSDAGGSTTGVDSGDSEGDGVDSGSDEAGNSPSFDVAGPDPDDPSPQDGCDSVDLLFVIDNSGSMGDNQAELVNSFPEFIDGIQTHLGGVADYHVGVVTTDAYSFNPATCQAAGDLITQTGGELSSNAVCGPYAVGGTYMTEADDLHQSFSCAAQVGTSGGGDEQPINSIRGALDPAHQAAGACNEGFLRDDSLLVIVIITDEDDLGGIPQPFQPPAGSEGSPPDWFDEIVAARGGLEHNIVVLALTGNDNLPDQCTAFHAENLITFAELFTHGFVGDVCASSYADFFAQAVGVVDTACDDFTPPG